MEVRKNFPTFSKIKIMRVITSIESTTRVFSVEDNDIYYKVRLYKDAVFYQWEIEGEDGEMIEPGSGLGNNLINCCEEKIKLENIK